jgi:hypothetical protein
MFTARKMIGSGSLLAVFVLSLFLAIPAPCAAASEGVDLPEIFIPKPPPPAPPPARA